MEILLGLTVIGLFGYILFEKLATTQYHYAATDFDVDKLKETVKLNRQAAITAVDKEIEYYVNVIKNIITHKVNQGSVQVVIPLTGIFGIRTWERYFTEPPDRKGSFSDVADRLQSLGINATYSNTAYEPDIFRFIVRFD